MDMFVCEPGLCECDWDLVDVKKMKKERLVLVRSILRVQLCRWREKWWLTLLVVACVVMGLFTVTVGWKNENFELSHQKVYHNEKKIAIGVKACWMCVKRRESKVCHLNNVTERVNEWCVWSEWESQSMMCVRECELFYLLFFNFKNTFYLSDEFECWQIFYKYFICKINFIL